MSISKKRSRKAAPPVSLAVELGLAIREEREAEGLTLAQLAERSGFDVAELQLMEDGTRIPTQEEIAVLGNAPQLSLAATVSSGLCRRSGAPSPLRSHLVFSTMSGPWGYSGAPGPGTIRMHKYS